MTQQVIPAYRKPESCRGPRGRKPEWDDARDFHQGQRCLCTSSTGRIYGSKPVPASQNAFCNMGGDHIRHDGLNNRHDYLNNRNDQSNLNVFTTGPATFAQNLFRQFAWLVFKRGGHGVIPAVQEAVQAHDTKDLHDLIFCPVLAHAGK